MYALAFARNTGSFDCVDREQIPAVVGLEVASVTCKVLSGPDLKSSYQEQVLSVLGQETQEPNKVILLG